MRRNPRGQGWRNPPGNKPINAGVPRGGRSAGQRQGGKSRNPKPDAGNQGRGGGRPKGRQGAPKLPSYLEPPTPKTISHETRAYTNQKFRPLERAIGAEKRASERRVGEVGDWWNDYVNTVNAGQADTAAAYAQAGQEAQSQVAQSSAIDNANTAQLQADAAKSAELRGVAPSAAPAERAAAAQGMRNYLSNAQSGATALSGANQRAYLNEQGRIGKGQSIASRKEEQRRTRKIEQDRTATRRERGDYSTTKRGELTDRAVERDIQSKAFGQEKREAGQKVAESAQERREARRQQEIENRQEQEKIGISKKGGGLTPSERRTIRNEKQAGKEGRQGAVKAAWSLYRAATKPPKTAQEWAAFESLVRSEEEITPSEAAYAIKKLKARVGSAATQGNRGLPGKPVPLAP